MVMWRMCSCRGYCHVPGDSIKTTKDNPNKKTRPKARCREIHRSGFFIAAGTFGRGLFWRGFGALALRLWRLARTLRHVLRGRTADRAILLCIAFRHPFRLHRSVDRLLRATDDPDLFGQARVLPTFRVHRHRLLSKRRSDRCLRRDAVRAAELLRFAFGQRARTVRPLGAAAIGNRLCSRIPRLPNRRFYR